MNLELCITIRKNTETPKGTGNFPSTADSARAKFYLNKCNEEILKTTQADQEPPQIRISSHADGEIVNTQVVKLNGTAVDDCYVNCVYVQGKNSSRNLQRETLRSVKMFLCVPEKMQLI